MRPGQIIQYLEGLTVTLGDMAGEPFTVLPWEKKFIRNAFAPGCTGDVAFTAGRGNGKSGLVAGLASAAVDPDGPLHRRRGEIICVAASFAQSKSAIYEEVLEFQRQRHGHLNSREWRVGDSQNTATLEHRPTGARVRCVGSKPKTVHGLKPYFVLADEPAQWETALVDPMFSALRTGLGKVPGSRLFALGTRPADEDHAFAKMLRSSDYTQVHAAHPEDPPFQRRTWKRANPSLDFMPSLEARIRIEAAEAKRDSAALASFRALRLNQGTSDVLVQVLIDADVWRKAEGDAAPEGDYVLGLDPGQTAAMSAAAAYYPVTGRLDTIALYGSIPDLAERGLKDGCGRRYLDMHKRGELFTCEGRTSDVGVLLKMALARWGKPRVITTDRWREDEVRDWLDKAEFPLAALEVRGMGFLDGAQDVREFRRAVLEHRVVPVRSLLLRSAMSEARTISNPAGDAKLCKGTEGGRRLRARDDAAAASVLAVAVGHRRRDSFKKPSKGLYHGRV